MRSVSYFNGSLPSITSTKPMTRPAGPGFWARVTAGIVKSREIQAKRETNRYLARQSDRFLLDIGLDQAEIANLRRQDGI